MGNQVSTTCSLRQIERLNLSPEQIKNIDLYVWRASSQTNQYIPRVKLNYPEESIFKKSSFNCMGTKACLNPNITFEEYVSDLRPLRSFLNVSEMLTVFRSVLKGHQTIFRKFNASIVSQKCSFVTSNGQVRIWINPNYYLNEFWSAQRRQFSLKNSSSCEISNQTPRFMNREEFEIQSAVQITSEPTLIRKIVQFMRQCSKNCGESEKFWTQLGIFISNSILSNCKFEKIETFINNFVYQNKVTLKSSISDVVKRLVSERMIFVAEKSSLKTYRSNKKNINATEKKISSIMTTNKTIAKQSTPMSILDIRSLPKHTPQASTSNLTGLNFQSTLQEGFYQKESRLDTIELPNTKTSIKEKRQEYRRKLSNSLIQTTRAVTSTNREDMHVNSQSQTFHIELNRRSQTSKMPEPQKPARNLSFSYQYSINLHTNQNTQHLHRASELTASQDASQNYENISYLPNNVQQSDNLGKSENFTRNSILKKGHTKSFEMQRGLNAFSNEREAISKKKHPSFLQPEQNDLFDVTQVKSVRLSNLEMGKSAQKVVDNSDFFNAFREESYTLKKIQNLDQTQMTILRTRQNSNCNLLSAGQSPTYQNRPFYQITNCPDSMKFFGVDKDRDHKKTINYNARFPGNYSRNQTSMLINLNLPNEEVQEQQIKSKRRISVGGEGETDLKLNNLSPNNVIGVDSELIPNSRTSRVISRLFSSENNLQTSVGSMSEFGDSQLDSHESRYSGILTKMGRSVQHKKVSDQYLLSIKEIDTEKIINVQEIMPNFTKKKTTYDHGSKRSMRI